MTSAPKIKDCLTIPASLAACSDACVTIHGARGVVTARASWRELHHDTDILARKLMSLGLGFGDRMGMVAETDLDFLRVFLAAQKAGLVPVPLPLPNAFGDRGAHGDRLERMLSAAGARAAFSAEAYGALLPPHLPVRLGPADLAALPESQRPLPPVGPDDLAFIQFSSGSTRFPKGVVIRQAAVMANAHAIRAALKTGAQDVCVSWLPLYHDMGLVGCFLAPLVAGMPLHLLPTREFVRAPQLWPRLISEMGGTVSYSPAFGYDLAARRLSGENNLDLTRWRIAGIGGDMIRPEALESFTRVFSRAGFRSRAFVPSYGLAEATLAVAMTSPGDGISFHRLDDIPRDFVRCGVPLPGMEIEIRNRDRRILAPGQVGHIHVRGPSLMSGYFHEAEETARVLDRDGWLDTGDLGLMVQGELVVTGRAKDLIIINGRNLWPQDLEWAAEQVEPLRTGDVAALAHMGLDGTEQVVLLVQCRLSKPDERQRLVEAVSSAVMASSGILCRVMLVPPRSLPRTSSGKLARSHARGLLEDVEPS